MTVPDSFLAQVTDALANLLAEAEGEPRVMTHQYHREDAGFLAPRIVAAIEEAVRESNHLSRKAFLDREQIWRGTYAAALRALGAQEGTR